MAAHSLQATGAATVLPKQFKVVSEPLNEVVGKGQNAKHVKDCTELYLGKRGIEQLAGFERLVNLEVLWLNDNKLTAINGLDNNIRIRQLYAHNNTICTLKGSLLKLKFLTSLDLSNNQLKDFNKLLKSIAKMRFVRELNLQGNPCCEEPDYRLLLIHAMPSLQVLDHHQVTTAERLQAAALIGGEAHILNVAFGAGLPPSVLQHRTAAAHCQQERSVLEQELAKMAESIKQKQQQAAEEAEAAQSSANPDANYWMPRSSLPPPPGLAKAQQAWAAATAATITTTTSSSNAHSNLGTNHAHQQIAGKTPTALWQGAAGAAGAVGGASPADVLQLSGSNAATASLLQGGILMSKGALMGTAAAGSSYKPKDVLVLRHYKQCSNADGHIAACSTSSSSGGGGDSRGLKARYLEGTFGHHLTERSWDVEAETLKL